MRQIRPSLAVQDVNILRDPWGSTGKVLRASGHELMHATREFWALVRPGGKLHPTKLFESQASVLKCDWHNAENREL